MVIGGLKQSKLGHCALDLKGGELPGFLDWSMIWIVSTNVFVNDIVGKYFYFRKLKWPGNNIWLFAADIAQKYDSVL